MRVAFVLAVAVNFTALAAQAGWQRTEWGMTESEFLAVYPSAVKKGTSYDLSPAPTQSAGATSARFDFPQGKLYRVVVTYEGLGYEQLKASVSAQFGRPSTEQERSCRSGLCSQRATFSDPRRRNVVETSEFMGRYFVSYTELQTGF